MSDTVEAIYEGGVFKPLTPVELPEHQRVMVHIPTTLHNEPRVRSFGHAPTLEELAREQGVNPFSFDALRESAWPEDENIDDFIAAIRRWRSGEE